MLLNCDRWKIKWLIIKKDLVFQKKFNSLKQSNDSDIKMGVESEKEDCYSE